MLVVVRAHVGFVFVVALVALLAELAWGRDAVSYMFEVCCDWEDEKLTEEVLSSLASTLGLQSRVLALEISGVEGGGC